MTDLSDKEKRLLTLAMALIGLEDLICSPLVDGDNVAACEDTYAASKAEYDRLFIEVDQDSLIVKLSSPFDPPLGNKSIYPGLLERFNNLQSET